MSERQNGQLSPKRKSKERKERPLVQNIFNVLVLILPLIGAIIWSTLPSARALLAVGVWQANPDMLLVNADTSSPVSLKRHVQKYFLDYGIYIPTEDIISDSEAGDTSQTLLFLMRKSCGIGKIYVWVPFKLRLPIIGEKVFEWCLKHR